MKSKKNMKLNLICCFLLLSTIVSAQNFFIGNKSYPRTQTFTLKSNSDWYVNDLEVFFAKDSDKILIVLSTKTLTEVMIKDKLLIYLDDGNVITCLDKNINDYVDGKNISVYHLTKDEVAKIKKSNIDTIRYSLKCGRGCSSSSEEGNYSASNVLTKYKEPFTNNISYRRINFADFLISLTE